MTFPVFVRRSIASCVVALAIAAHAQITVITDDFSGAGNLTGSTPDSGVGSWTNISGTSGSIQVAGGAVSLATNPSEAVQLNFSSSDQTSGTIYAGFTFTVSSSGTINTSDTVQSIFGFRQGTAASGSFAVGFGDFRPSANAISFNSGLPSTSTSQVAVGIFAGSSLNAASNSLTYWSSALSRGTTYTAVLGFNLTANTVSLWIDPTSSSSTSVTMSGVTANARGVFLRQGNASNGALGVDNLSVSTDFNTAAGISPVPEPSTYAAIFGAMALAGVIYQRRRAAARATAA